MAQLSNSGERLDSLRVSGGIELMKASAGSGKTYSLSREYICTLLKGGQNERHYHRHILAVTFTNKATESMKSKIISDLHTIVDKPSDCGFSSYLKEKCGFADDRELSKAARRALNDLLNDYGAFSVSTIDKFFQKTLKSFACEIGQSSDYRVELDRESLIEEAADRLLDSLSVEDDSLLKWLSDTTLERIENGEKFNLDSSLKDFAKGFLSPEYKMKAEELGVNEELAFSEDNLKKLTAVCRNIIREYDKAFVDCAKKADEALKNGPARDVKSRDLNYLRSRLAKYLAYEGGPIDFSAKGYWTNACEDFSKCIPTSSKIKLSEAEAERLTSLFQTLDSFSGRNYYIRRTAGMLSQQIYVFRTAEALRREYDGLLSEMNVLGLDDTNSILKDIIGGTDAPFIYEKTGTRYKHFLLDEFQDTSVIQWECFKPLLMNSIAEGWYNLIVGDVKQSIYRWRNADWRILGEQVERDMQRVLVNPLQTNWRSAGNIVRFNNKFHSFMAESKGESLLYSDVIQQISPAEKVEGCVDIAFCSKDVYMEHILSSIGSAHERGFRYMDMAVIVRTNKEGGMIADLLSRNGIPVVTDDSLRIGCSSCVRKVIAGLTILDCPEDRIGTYEADGSFEPESLESSRSLFEMADSLFRQLPVEDVNREALFVLAFMDLVREFSSSKGNSLHSFLKMWKETGLKKTISCPKGTDAVTIITIHKSKGLDYPFVLLPIPQYSRNGNTAELWAAPDISGTALESCTPALYHVTLTEDSLFREDYEKEKRMAEVDNLNTWYVAMTRPKQELCIISPEASGNSPLSQDLKRFLETTELEFSETKAPIELQDAVGEKYSRYIYGTPVVKQAPTQKKLSNDMHIEYFPESGMSGVKGQVRISDDAAEYFLGDDSVARRKRGIVLHGIMQHINAREDIYDAVGQAVMSGDLDAASADATWEELSEALKTVEDRGWFGNETARVLSERDILSAGGKERRPDRVIIENGKVSIIDYKFGDSHKSYIKQVNEYKKLFKLMGYEDVNAYLWYVLEHRVEEY